ncbi:MAG TPA: rhodanese-like domain-containing protein [Candidatus Cybelea sp.]|nr:rhodanese-like domain-containing protein [Candidatus Cybelea sp.]
MQSITASELMRRLGDGSPPFLLDVREPDEVAEDGAIAGSTNVPMRDVRHRLDEIPTDRDIVVICHLGVRSEYVTRGLNALGYGRAVNLEGGMNAWLRAISATR